MSRPCPSPLAASTGFPSQSKSHQNSTDPPLPDALLAPRLQPAPPGLALATLATLLILQTTGACLGPWHLLALILSAKLVFSLLWVFAQMSCTSDLSDAFPDHPAANSTPSSDTLNPLFCFICAHHVFCHMMPCKIVHMFWMYMSVSPH